MSSAMNTVKFMSEGNHTITPYLTVKDAQAAILFYQRVSQAKTVGRIRCWRERAFHGMGRIALDMPELLA